MQIKTMALYKKKEKKSANINSNENKKDTGRA